MQCGGDGGDGARNGKLQIYGGVYIRATGMFRFEMKRLRFTNVFGQLRRSANAVFSFFSFVFFI